MQESGLHADFKLDKSGGQIYLSHEDLSFVDSVDYADQTTNLALARVPNGTGNFILQDPTFNASNAVSNTSIPAGLPLELAIHPHPVTDLLAIRINTGDLDHPVSFRILNVLGQPVSTVLLQNNPTTIDVHHLSPGIYYLNGTIGQARIMKKFLISGK